VDDKLAGHYRLAVVRGHLLEMAGDRDAAVTQLRAAAAGTRSQAELAFLLTEIARLRTAVADVNPPSRDPGTPRA